MNGPTNRLSACDLSSATASETHDTVAADDGVLFPGLGHVGHLAATATATQVAGSARRTQEPGGRSRTVVAPRHGPGTATPRLGCANSIAESVVCARFHHARSGGDD